MGIIKGVLLTIVSVLLIISFFLTGGLFTLSGSLEYENIQGELVPIVVESLDVEGAFSNGINDNYALIADQCSNKTEVVFGEGPEALIVSCEVVLQGPDAIFDDMVMTTVDRTYYAEYDCNFLDCFDKYSGEPYFLVSDHSHDYFSSKKFLFLVITLILFACAVFLSEVKSSGFILGGVLLIIASLPFAKLEWFLSLFAAVEMLQFFSFMFMKASSVFWSSLFIGLFLIIVGVVWKLFATGFKINSLIEKFKSYRSEKASEKLTSENVSKKKS